MKKRLLVLAFAGLSAAVSAQNFSIIDAGQANVTNTTQNFYIDQNLTDAQIFTVNNISSGSIVLKVRRTIVQLNTPSAVTSFCTNTNCYSSTQNLSLAVTLPAGGHFDLTSDYFPDSIAGMGHVRYTILNQGNTSDSLAALDVVYNSSPAGISAPALVKASISNPAPNPASSVFAVNYKLGSNTPANSKMVIYNMLGARVLETRVEESEGAVKMDVSSLEQGIYFCALETDGKTLATRRLVVTH